ncbi:SKI/DACH domain-containing protein 1 [Engraulis encrasicolus]|uniref:SKI/DACH domain-containing protein 1 n=1 Tax=Engraulis encrasicolus TaxID=184585 RepID=UPI002FD1BA9B
MGDLESGFEEMQGVKLGYLVIKGKQMFALSQVFTDLLKNIPRTTVHKRMDHLNVKKHHCDLEELRKLKAINSIAFHAAKCTLISREDVEALYFSCKTERVLKSNKRKVKGKPPEDVCVGQADGDSQDGFWKEKVWLSLHSVPQTFPVKNKAGRQDTACRPDSNLPQIYSKTLRHNFQSVTKSASKTFKNYETTQIPSNYVAYNQRHSFFRNAASRQPALYQSAIAPHSKLAGTADLLYRRKRKRESTGRQFWNRSRPNHQLLFVPKCCKTKIPNGSYHLDHDLYLDHQHSGNYQESCSSDTESSSYSERVNNDSDFGSSLSTSSNSGTSDEEDESFSESSDISSDEESSSQSDSSSVSSQVSMQSIRFRRARFTSLNTKTPLLLQPTFHYNLQQRPSTHSGAAVSADDKCKKQQKYGFRPTKCRDNHQEDSAMHVSKFSMSAAERYLVTPKGEGVPYTPLQFEFPNDPKTEDHATSGVKDTGPFCINGNKAFIQQRTSGHTNKCPQALISHCAQDNETIVSTSSENNLSLSTHFKREVKSSHCSKQPSPLKAIKTEADETIPASSFATDSKPVQSPTTLLNNVKIKVENPYDEYEYGVQGHAYSANVNESEITDSQDLEELKHSDRSSSFSSASESTASVPKKARSSPETDGPLKNTCPVTDAEYKNGARIRKNYRSLALGSKAGPAKIEARANARTDRSPRPAGKVDSSEGSGEGCTGASKRKRASSNGSSSVKKPFNFMANFPFPPSLVLGSDGDLTPAYSLNSLKNNELPHKSHPVWTWQIGKAVVPPPPSQRFRKC